MLCLGNSTAVSGSVHALKLSVEGFVSGPIVVPPMIAEMIDVMLQCASAQEVPTAVILCIAYYCVQEPGMGHPDQFLRTAISLRKDSRWRLAWLDTAMSWLQWLSNVNHRQVSCPSSFVEDVSRVPMGWEKNVVATMARFSTLRFTPQQFRGRDLPN